jgi:hypothetical protein
VSKSMPAEQTVEFFLQLTSNHDRRDCTWNETLVRFHLPATALMKNLVITTGDTVDSGTSCAISQAQKGVSERLRLTIVASANPLSCLRQVRNCCRWWL